MKIYDISQEVFSSRVYPGDPEPGYQRLQAIEEGAVCNLTAFHMCAHNGTHIDAPYHFIENGRQVNELQLDRMIGEATVATVTGELSAADIAHIMKDSHKRLLLKGRHTVTLEAAREMAGQGILLLGVESQTVGPEDTPMAVHLELLSKEVILLEGLVLTNVPDGNYLLNAAPLNLAGADGSPCRAVLLK